MKIVTSGQRKQTEENPRAGKKNGRKSENFVLPKIYTTLTECEK